MIIDIARLYELGQEIKSSGIGINKFRMVDGPDKVVECLKDFDAEENHLLLMVLPSHNATGSTSFDDLEFQNYTQFLILEKYDPREFEDNHAEMMVFHRTLETTKKLIEKLKNDFFNQTEFCGLLSTIKAGSIQIDPIRHQSDTSGYSLLFTF